MKPVFGGGCPVAVLVYPGVDLGNLDGPLDVSTTASGMTKGQCHCCPVARAPGPPRTQGGAPELTPAHVEVLVFVCTGAHLLGQASAGAGHDALL